MKVKLPKTLRYSADKYEIRSVEQDESKMIIEGYPIIFDKETLIFDGEKEFYESIDRHAFDDADISDVALKYNHNDNFLILARTRNNSLILSIDDHGVFMHSELLDTTDSIDVYKRVKSGLLKEGSFAFTIEAFERWVDADGIEHRKITKIGKLFDVAICPNGAYGDLTEIYARSYDLLESKDKDKAEALKRCEILRLKNINKIKIMRCKKWKRQEIY